MIPFDARHQPLAVAACLACFAVPRVATAQADPLPYRNPELPVALRVRDLMSRMTLEEKFWQLFMIPGDLDSGTAAYAHGVFGLQIGTAGDAEGGAGRVARGHARRINAIQRFFVERTRLGIPIVPFDEALHGLARAGATAFPQAVGLAATWDTALVGRVAGAIATETRSRGVRQVLSPVVNIADDVRWGRVEETYGEDPSLASRMGSAFVRAFERSGIITTPKHFVANVGQGGRDSYPIDHSERLLDEYYFPPFRAAIDAGARSIMTAYNSVDGLPATQNRWLLTDVLRGAWGFDGFVISDAAATGGATVLHFTEPDTPTAARHAFEAGLDVVFQSAVGQYRPYWQAFERGLIADSVIEAAVARVLRAKFAMGLFELPFVDPDSAAYWNGHPDHRALAREAARASMVLLKNDRAVLPLSETVRTVAVIGADADEARLGGYAGPGNAKVSILHGIRSRLGASAIVRFASGPGRVSPDHVTVPGTYLTPVEGEIGSGLRGEYFDNNALAGQPVFVRTDREVNARWTLNAPGRGIPFDWYSVRWTGTIAAPSDGVARLGVEGNDGYRLYLDGELLVDNWRKQSYRTVMADVNLEPGSSHDIRLEYFESTGNARVKLVWDAGIPDWRPTVDSAVAIVRQSDVAVVVAGIEEGEFRDRALLGLPGHQEALIAAVAETGTPVVVVLIGGSAITMSRWLDRVDGVIDAWYPGEAGGDAVADVLFGDYNPGGRLPITFPLAEGQLPLSYFHKPTGRGDDYVDLTGYPLFPFGFGLSYTRFEYSALSVDPEVIGAGDTVTVRFRLRNVGDRAGDEVPQLYVRDLLATRSRPVMALQGFTRVHLQPGEAREIVFRLTRQHLSMLDGQLRRIVEPGTFRIMVGASSADIRLRGLLQAR